MFGVKALATRSLLVALCCRHATAFTMARPTPTEPPTKALMVTMVYPDDQVPVDLMLEHHVRMVAGGSSIVEAAILDNRPPWMENTSTQEPLLDRFRRREGSTSTVTVKSVDYTRLSSLLERFFGFSGERQLGARREGLGLLQDAPRNLSRLDEKSKAARLLGMLSFLELCADASTDVDQCIYIDSTTFVYRDSDTGIVELAAKMFRQDPSAVVLQPPSLCSSNLANQRGICKAVNATDGIEHGFFVINRDRFEGFAPMKVEGVELSSRFEAVLAEGLTKGGVEGAVKKMRCSGVFAIHPYDNSLGYACKPGQSLTFQKHAKALMDRPSHIGMELPLGYHAMDYERFGTGVERAVAVKALIDRFESGKFPEDKYRDSVTEKCLSMCPSRDRIKDGFAW